MRMLPVILATIILQVALPVAVTAQQVVAARIEDRARRQGGGDEPRLETLLALQRAVSPGAVVTGRFMDWRSVSRYRRQAGLHLGYDIAMPAGSRAVAGWTGQVLRITPWFGVEHGITVLSPSGYQVTYGHLVPLVRVGDVLNAGDVVGTVVVDHVDVKMQSPMGQYYDFGQGEGLARSLSPPGPVPGPRHALVAEADAVRRLQELEEKFRGALERSRLDLGAQRESLQRMRFLLARGAVARLEVDAEESRLRAAESRVAELLECWETARAKRALHAQRLRLLGSTGAGTTPARLSMPSGPPRPGLARLEMLYRRGAISRQDLEKARRGQEAPVK